MPKEFFRTSKRCKLLPRNSFDVAKLCLLVFSFLVCLFFSSSSAFANNLTVSNAAIVDQDTGADTVKIQFTVSWENSWRDATNYDAVWVFAKYCTENCSTTGTWSHATLKTSGTNPSGFSDGTGTALDIVVPTDKKGAFLQRSGNGTGTVTNSKVQLVWDYGADGVSDADAVGTNTRIRVFGIEMVYVPGGVFYAGDGSVGVASSTAAFRNEESPTADPWYFAAGEAYLDVTASSNGTLAEKVYISGGNGAEDTSFSAFTIPVAFPTGYAAFYMMKYEVTQGQYRDFLNCLTREDQAKRVAVNITDAVMSVYLMSGVDAVTYRNGIRTSGDGGSTNRLVVGCDLNANGLLNEPADGEWIAMNYMSWMDLCAYADWAALRPMTELEFEKAARGGGVTPANLEYAWGSSSGSENVYDVTNGGTSNELSTVLTSNLNTGNQIQGPVRVGMFAKATSTREQAGAGYYGAMELGGNLWERVVTVGNAAGRAFTGTHGDGVLGTAACATNSDWPGWTGVQVTDAFGSGFRGGSWDMVPTRARVSDRTSAAYVENVGYAERGGRAVRTAE